MWYTVGVRYQRILHSTERFLYLQGDVFQLKHLTKKVIKPMLVNKSLMVVDVEEVNGRFKLKAKHGKRIYNTNNYDQVAVLLTHEVDGKEVTQNITRDCIWADTETGEALVIQRLEDTLLPLSEYAMINGKSTAVPLSEVVTGTITVYKIKEDNNED